MKTDEISISLVSAIFLVYVAFVSFDIYLSIAFIILLASPILLIYMVYSILKHGAFFGKELEDGQEFGYLDRPNLGKSIL